MHRALSGAIPWFADWFEERQGIAVPELSAPVELDQPQLPF